MAGKPTDQSTKYEKQTSLREYYRSKFLGPPVTKTEKNIRSVLSKQLIDAAKQRRHEGKLVISNSQIHTVKMCGMITHIDQQESHTDYQFFDGTGTVEGRLWQKNNDGSTELSGASLLDYYMVVANVIVEQEDIKLQTLKASMVCDYNKITLHMLEVIHEHCMLSQLSSATVDQWTEAKKNSELTINTKFTAELNKEAVYTMFNNNAIRTSFAGATLEQIIRELQLDDETARKTLTSMLDEGSIYNTIDYNHFKLADNN